MKILILAHSEPQIRVFLQNCLWRIPGGTTHRVKRIHSIDDMRGYARQIVYALPGWMEGFRGPVVQLIDMMRAYDFRQIDVTEEQVLGKEPFELVPYEFWTPYKGRHTGNIAWPINPVDQEKMLREANAMSPIVNMGLKCHVPFIAIILELAKENKRLTDALVAKEMEKVEYVPPVAGHRAGSV